MFGTARAANEALAIVQQIAAMKALLSNQGGNGLRYLQVCMCDAVYWNDEHV
jgi:hypothetical protein